MKLRDRLRRYFVSGFFTLIPISLSLFVVWWMVSAADAAFAPAVDAALGWHLPGLGLVFAAAAILAAGALASQVVGERLLAWAESAFLHVPAFKWVYGTIKQMTEAFSPDKKSSFQSVVIIEYPRPGVYSLGFVTRETLLELPDGMEKPLVSVYVPTNHVYIGDLVLVPKEHVLMTSIGVQQGIQAALSAGASLPARLGGVPPAHGRAKR